MKKTLSRVASAVFAGALLTMAVAPAIAVAAPAAGVNQNAENPADQVKKFTEDAAKVETDATTATTKADKAAKDAGDAKTKDEAKAAGELAAAAKTDATAVKGKAADLQKAIDGFLNNAAAPAASDSPERDEAKAARAKATTAIETADKAIQTADKAADVAAAKAKADDTPPVNPPVVNPPVDPPVVNPPAEDPQLPKSVDGIVLIKGDEGLALIVTCAAGTPSDVQSNVLSFEHPISTKNGWVALAKPREDAKPGKSIITAKCGDKELRLELGKDELDKAAAHAKAKAKSGKGTQVKIKPKGGVQTGGGFTAQD